MQELISLTEARDKGLPNYFTGKPCRAGHIDQRRTSSKHCVACRRESHAKRNREGADKDSRRLWAKANPERVKQHARTKRLKQYGLTPEDFECMRLDQHNCCVICTLSFVGPPRVDHCHTTGSVRGLLCHHCNVMLGNARDNIKTLSRAIEYLKDAERKSRDGSALTA